MFSAELLYFPMQFRKEESEARGNHLDVMNSTTGKHGNIFRGIFFDGGKFFKK